MSRNIQLEEKKQILSENYNIAMVKEMESEVSTMCNLSDAIENRGREEGREEGELRKQTATIIRMLTMQYSLPQIIAISVADEETIRTIAKENGLTIHE